MTISLTPTGRERRARIRTDDNGDTDGQWRWRSACRNPGYDPDWWTAGWETEAGYAVWVCQNQCPVRRECGRWASDHPDLAQGAVYGGVMWTTRSKTGQPRPSSNQPIPVRPSTVAGRYRQPEVKQPARRSGVQPCGTRAAYYRHLQHHEPPCEPCDAARRDYDQQRRAAREVA